MPAAAIAIADLRCRVDDALTGFLRDSAPHLHALGDELAPFADSVTEFVLEGGKRLRPAFCYWGWRGADGTDGPQIVAAAAGLELLHACALIHDDVMDRSDTRRGRPAVHRRFAALHRAGGWHGSPEHFGTAAAILAGNLCLIWSSELLMSSGLPADALLRGQPVYDEMRVELMAGQYLDLLEQAVGDSDLERALRVARYKSAKYTVERPLHLGGALAGGGGELIAGYSAYGLPLGEAFQLRDDMLGVFGDPDETGKPAGDDLREGKRTVLVATALDHATPAQADAVRRHLGDPDLDDDGVDELRTLIEQTGARAEVERLITALGAQAHEALAGLTLHDDVRTALLALAQGVVGRAG